MATIIRLEDQTKEAYASSVGTVRLRGKTKLARLPSGFYEVRASVICDCCGRTADASLELEQPADKDLQDLELQAPPLPPGWQVASGWDVCAVEDMAHQSWRTR